jgi:hypothetical protein
LGISHPCIIGQNGTHATRKLQDRIEWRPSPN